MLDILYICEVCFEANFGFEYTICFEFAVLTPNSLKCVLMKLVTSSLKYKVACWFLFVMFILIYNVFYKGL